MGSSKKKKQKKADDAAAQQRAVMEQQERARLQQQTQQAEQQRQQMMQQLQAQQAQQQAAYAQQQKVLEQIAQARNVPSPVAQPQPIPTTNPVSNQQAPATGAAIPTTSGNVGQAPPSNLYAEIEARQKAEQQRLADLAEATRLKQEEFARQQAAQMDAQKRAEAFQKQQMDLQLQAYGKQLEEFKAATQGQLSTISNQSQAQLKAQQDAQEKLLSQLSGQFQTQTGALGEQVNAYKALAGNQEEQLKLLEGEYTRAKSDKIQAQAEATQPMIREVANQQNRNKLLTHLSSLRGRGYNPEYNKGKLLR